jgi:hypothetical protein
LESRDDQREAGYYYPLPAAWSAEVTPNCFIVRDHDGHQLAYVYFGDEPGRRSAAKLLTQRISPSCRSC